MNSSYGVIVEQLKELSNRWKSYLLDNSLMGTEPLTSLWKELEGISDVLDTPEVSNEIITLKKVSPIDKLGLGLSLLKLYELDRGEKEIASILSSQSGMVIKPSEVKDWIEGYTNAGYLEKFRMVRGSVFDTQNRMQEIFETLYSCMEEIKNKSEEDYRYKKVTKEEIILEHLKEIRQITKDARVIIESVDSQNRNREFQNIVIEAIGTVSPQVQQQILRSMREHKSVISSLVPF